MPGSSHQTSHSNNEQDQADRKMRERPVSPLSAKERLYSKLVNSLGGIVWEADAQPFRYTFVSSQAERILGYPLEQWLNEPDFWRNHAHPDDFESSPSFCLGEAAHYRDHEVEYRMLAADGSVVWLNDIVTVIVESDGSVQLRGIMIDVTERKLGEALLNGQKKVLEMVAMGTPLRETLDALVRLIEQQSSDMLGSILLLEADGVHVSHGAAPSLRDSFTRAFDGAAIGDWSCGAAAFRREPVIVADITTDPLWEGYRSLALENDLRACWSTPIFDAQKRVLGVFSLYFRKPGRPAERHGRLIEIATQTAALAITRQREEEALRASELRYRTLVEISPDAIWINRNGRIAFTNSAGVKMMGAERAEDILGKSPFDLIHPDYHAVVRERIGKIQAGQSVPMLEEKLVRLDGTVLDIELAAAAMTDAEGEAIQVVIRDITDRKRAEDNLRREKEFSETALESLPGAFFVRAASGEFLRWNKNFELFSGYSAEEIKSWREGIIAASYHRPLRDAKILECLEKGWVEVELDGVSKDGVTRPYYLTARSIEIDGKACVVGMGIDISERRRAEEALRRNEELFRAIVEDQSEMIVRWKPDGTRTFVNQAYCRVLGKSAEDLVGRSFFPLVMEKYREGIREKIRSLTPDNPLATQSHQSISANGETYWQEWTHRGVFDAGGNLVELQSTGRDITESKRAEEALRLSENRYRRIVQLAPEAIVVADMATGKFVDFNPRALALFKLSAEEILGVGPVDMSPALQPDGRASSEAAMAYIQRALAGETPVFEWMHRSSSGEDIPCEIRLFQLPDESRLLVRGTIIDITERKQAEEQLKATSEQLRALMATLRRAREDEGIRIAREIHDELGSALTSLRWDLETIDRAVAESGNSSSVGELRERLAAMTSLIDDTVNVLRRISSELRPSVLDDLGLAAAIEWQAQQFEARTGIICHCDGLFEDSDLNQDQSTAIFRIFQEALTNVMRHAAATRIETKMERKDGLFVLTIADNGKGIAEREKMSGRSLGLLGMRERAQLIDGEVDLIGIAGEGTTVIVRVPVFDDRND